MNFKRITLSLICGAMAGVAMSQALPPIGRVFNYDGTVGTNGLSTYVLNGDGAGAYLFAGSVNGSGNQNGIVGASITNAAFLANTVINVSSYVYISGNFGGVYNVQGIGAGDDPLLEQNQIEIATNRNLTFTASGFYGLGSAIGYVGYTMSLLQDYPTNGVVLAGTGPFLDDQYFNGATVSLTAAGELPLDGRATLQLTRQLQLTQAAVGGHTYTVSGTIQVGVN